MRYSLDGTDDRIEIHTYSYADDFCRVHYDRDSNTVSYSARIKAIEYYNMDELEMKINFFESSRIVRELVQQAIDMGRDLING